MAVIVWARGASATAGVLLCLCHLSAVVMRLRRVWIIKVHNDRDGWTRWGGYFPSVSMAVEYHRLFHRTIDIDDWFIMQTIAFLQW